MDARCSFRVRRRAEAGGGILFPVLSFLSFCLCRSRRVHPAGTCGGGGVPGVSGPAVWGYRCRRRRHAGEYNLTADTLSVGGELHPRDFSFSVVDAFLREQ